MIKNKTMPYNAKKKHVEKKTPHARDRPFAKKAKECVKKAGSINLKKIFLQNFPYILCAYAGNLLSCFYNSTEGEALNRVMETLAGISRIAESPVPSMKPADIMAGIICGAALKTAVYTKGKNAKKYRHGIEYGSARWGNEKDIEPYTDDVFENNVILTATERLTMSDRPKEPKYARNKNVLVIGGSGSGKTRFFLKPNLMQMHSSYVITDPKGTVVNECGKMLEKGVPVTDENGGFVKDGNGKVVYEPYRIKIFNTINFKKSMHYNPFAYIRDEKDILTLVDTLVANTNGGGKQDADGDFWTKAEKLLYQAYIGYIWYECIEEEKNFTTLVDMLNASETKEDDENFKNAIDIMFEELEAREPEHFAVRQYKKYKLAAGKTAKSILVSCGARLAPFDIAGLREILSYDELELGTLGEKRTALFVIISDTDAAFNFIVSIMYTQLFNLLCDKAYNEYGGVLPVHVRMLLDEFANTGKIPEFEKKIAVIRSRGISASVVLQSKSQLKAVYKDNAETIESNCDSVLFLGGKEKSTIKEISGMLGKETIDLYNTSDTRGTQRSYGLNYQKTGKDMPYLFVKSWLPKTKINRTGTRSADNSANHVFFISFYLVQFCTSEKVYKGIMG